MDFDAQRPAHSILRSSLLAPRHGTFLSFSGHLCLLHIHVALCLEVLPPVRQEMGGAPHLHAQRPIAHLHATVVHPHLCLLALCP